MDLRKSVLTKQSKILCETSLNISSASAYESAVDDSTASLYYSFSNESASTLEISNQDESEFDNQSTLSCEADKENTIIMRKQTSPVIESSKSLLESSIKKTESLLIVTSAQQNEKMSENLNTESLKEESFVTFSSSETLTESTTMETENMPTISEEGDKVQLSEVIFEQSLEAVEIIVEKDGEEMIESSKKLTNEIAETGIVTELVDVAVTAKPVELPEVLSQINQQKVSDPVPEMPRHLLSQVESPYSKLEENAMPAVEIVIQDPNENVINPFTAIVASPSPVIDQKPEKRVTRRSVISTMVPAKVGYYSPVLRKSLERKVKVTNKPQSVRRTIYGPMKVPSQTVKPKTPTQIPQPKPVVVKPTVKPKLYKCPETGCSAETTTARAYQEHLKQHKQPTNSTSFNSACKYCDKKFQLEAALLNHQADKCTRIPFNEKRKLTILRDKKEKNRRETALFTMPVPKMKSPSSRRQSTKLNKSGIMITPRKTLKCHICKAIVADALSFTNHILAHKFNKMNNEKS